MGRRGPKPKADRSPAAAARSVSRPRAASRAAQLPEPEGNAEVPAWLCEPPTCLGDDARAEWVRVIPELSRLGLLSEADLGILTTYCSSFGVLQRCEREIASLPSLTFITERGFPMAAPQLAIRNQAAASLAAAAEKLGLTPNSRSRIGGDDPDQRARRDGKKPKDPAEKFFS